MIDFTPSLDRNLIIHADKWTLNYGRTWNEWDNCVGPCEGCKANAEDMGIKLPPVKIGDHTENVWDNFIELWVWEHLVTEQAKTVEGSDAVWSRDNEWWYELWSFKIPKDFLDEKDEWINNAYANGEYNSTLSKERASYFYGSADNNDGIWYLMSLGGMLLKETRDNVLSGSIMDYKDFVMTLDPPPNMFRDNTLRINNIQNRISGLNESIASLNSRINELEIQIQNTYEQRLIDQLKSELSTSRMLLIDAESQRSGLTVFLGEMPETSLYHEEYQFDIMAIS